MADAVQLGVRNASYISTLVGNDQYIVVGSNKNGKLLLVITNV